jgi:replication initiation and membrane attachment protein DnaB
MSKKFYGGTSYRLLFEMKNLAAVGLLQAFVSFTLSKNRICKTLEISSPARLHEFFHCFGVVNREIYPR